MVFKSIDSLTFSEIASICDHTFLNRSECYKEKSKKMGISCMELRENEFRDFYNESVEFQPYAVCVRPEDVSKVSFDFIMKDILINIASVVGFPDGSLYNTEAKVAEAGIAIENGANEIDMVLDYNKLNMELYREVEKDINKVVRCAEQEEVLVKLILETSELESWDIKQACRIATNCGVDFVKTSTGFGAYGARVEDLLIMRKNFKGGIKISGGVNPNNYQELLKAASGGVDGQIDLDPLKIRIGESSLLSKLSKL